MTEARRRRVIGRRTMLDLLPAWLAQQRWFAGKGRVAAAAPRRRPAPRGPGRRVDARDRCSCWTSPAAEPTVYQVPLHLPRRAGCPAATTRWSATLEDATRRHRATSTTRLHDPARRRSCCDACWPRRRAAVRRTPAAPRGAGPPAARRAAARRSRVPRAARRADQHLGHLRSATASRDRHLQGVPQAARPATTPTSRSTRPWPRGGSTHVADGRSADVAGAWPDDAAPAAEPRAPRDAQEFLPGGRGLRWQRATCRRGDLHAEVGGDFAGEARAARRGHRRGARRAAPRRCPPAAATEDAARPRWPSDAGPARRAAPRRGARRCAGYAEALRAAFDDARGRRPTRPRCSGCTATCHLGQMLRRRPGWLDPARLRGRAAAPLAERRRPDLPLRDVAGMLRSFDYAAGTRSATGRRDPQAAYRAAEWAERNRDAFCDGYADAAGPRPARATTSCSRAFEPTRRLRGGLRGPQPARLAVDPAAASTDSPATRRQREEHPMTPTAHRQPPCRSPAPSSTSLVCTARTTTRTRVLGPHPHDGGVTVRALRAAGHARSWSCSPTATVARSRTSTTASGSAVLPTPTVPDYRLEVAYGDGAEHRRTTRTASCRPSARSTCT